MKVLLLEDDFTLSNELKIFLNGKGFACDLIFDGSLFVKKAKTDEYDVFILDINVPGMNGMEVCGQIRQENKVTPIIMLTAFSEIEEKIASFEQGADDYLVKPFHFDELHQRLLALLRRKSVPLHMDNKLTIEDLIIDIRDSVVYRGGKEIILTPKEFKLLHILASQKGRVISKQSIADSLWDDNVETSLNTIEVFINFLRKKIDRDFETKLLHTKQGFGYYLKAIK